MASAFSDRADPALRRVRILAVTVPLPSNDKPNTMSPLTHQLRSLRRLGVDVDLLEVAGIQKLKYVQARSRLGALARDVDLIHAHFGFCGWLARSQFPKPVVVSFMGSDLLGTRNAQGNVVWMSKLEVQVNRWLARTMDAVIVKSRTMADVIAPLDAHVVPNGVDLELFRPIGRRVARATLGWPEGPRYVLFPGDPDNPGKGYPLASAAVGIAAGQVPGRLILVPLKNVPPDKVPLYMNACDAMLLTSFSEGSPNVVKEAMGCNVPAVSVPVGDVPDLFARASGYAVAPRDPQALASALVHTLRTEQPAGGRAVLIQKGLDLMTVARRLLDIYHSVLERASPVAGGVVRRRPMRGPEQPE